MVYMGHRRWLPRGHVWRKKKELFDGTVEHRAEPEELSIDQLLQKLTHVVGVQFGKVRVKKRKHTDVALRGTKEKHADVALNWRKKCIFFKLPYWSLVKLRHNLDIMYIEKNICDSILVKLMNNDGKTKDTFNARRDLREMGIRKELHLLTNGAATTMPLAKYTLTKDEKKKFCDWLKGVKFPDRYASNIARCVNKQDSKIIMSSYSTYFML
ncbi:hypothetical protein SLA2020_276370 [Shorea laevis]